jgi:hypothetical protein
VKVVRWYKPLSRKNGYLRSSFGSWKIPPEKAREIGISDGQSIDAVLRFGQELHSGDFRVSSGGEIQVRSKLAERIRGYAKRNPDDSVAFSVKMLSTASSDIDQAEAKGELKDVPETERNAIIAARLGQGFFRANLMRVYKRKCAVTGTDIPELLRASHIKPWRDCDNPERLCVDTVIRQVG